MPPNLESTKLRARYVWRNGEFVYVSFPTLLRAFIALQRLAESGRVAEYDGNGRGRHWVRFMGERVAAW